MTRLLMMVHGMGVHGADWASEVVTDLKRAATPFGLADAFTDTLDGDGATLVPIRYDDRFIRWLEKWGHDSRALAAFIRKQSIDVPDNIVTWLEDADAQENNVIWSHVVDVILYRYFNQVTTDVRVHVARDIARCWRDALDADPDAEVSIIAHSLGTSVVHDALGLLATDPPPRATGFLAGDRRLANLFMLCNVSRILETSPKAYDSVIAPPSVRGDHAYCGNYVTVRHLLDPFAAPRAFAPAWGGEDFLQLQLTEVHDFDVHAFSHYVRDPVVHVPLLRALFGFDALDPATISQVATSYEASGGPPCVRALEGFVRDCRQRVQLIEDSSDIRALLTAGVHFLTDLKDVKVACTQEVA